MAGRERDWKLWNGHESEEVPHDLIDHRRRFKHAQRRTYNPGRQGRGEMERHPPRHKLAKARGTRLGETWEPETPELRAEVLADRLEERDAELAKEQGRPTSRRG